MNGSGKRSSLLLYDNNYILKVFYGIDPGPLENFFGLKCLWMERIK